MKVYSCRNDEQTKAPPEELTYEQMSAHEGIYRCVHFKSYFLSIEGTVLRFEAGVGVFNADKGGWRNYTFVRSEAVLCMEIKDAQ